MSAALRERRRLQTPTVAAGAPPNGKAPGDPCERTDEQPAVAPQPVLTEPAPFDPRWGLFTVDLELTNRCGQSCAFCPRHAITRPRGTIALDLVRAIAGRLAPITAQVTLSGMGDPTAHPQFDACIEILRAHGLSTGLQVNAASLTARVRDRILAARPSFINLSLPSTKNEVLARLVPYIRPATLLANVERLAAAVRGRPPVTLIAVTTGLKDDRDALLHFAKRQGLNVRLLPCHSRGGNFVDGEILPTQAQHGPKRSCGLFARHGFVTWRGELLACCHDLSGETRLGNLATAPLATLLAQKKERAAAKPAFAVCSRCDEPLQSLELPTGTPPSGRKQRQRYFRSLARPTPNS